MNMLIEARDINKSYALPGKAPIPILHGISLEAAEGEMVTIIGASGSGKTTLLNMLGTLDTPDSGTITFEGESSSSRMADTGRNKKKLALFRNRKIRLCLPVPPPAFRLHRPGKCGHAGVHCHRPTQTGKNRGRRAPSWSRTR